MSFLIRCGYRSRFDTPVETRMLELLRFSLTGCSQLVRRPELARNPPKSKVDHSASMGCETIFREGMPSVAGIPTFFPSIERAEACEQPGQTARTTRTTPKPGSRGPATDQQPGEQLPKNPGMDANRSGVVGRLGVIGRLFPKLFTDENRRKRPADGHPNGLYVLFTDPTTDFPFLSKESISRGT